MHENHRERMRNRYYIGGFDAFSEHEILEMILYHSIPRGDTNELAHSLIEHFGSFSAVIEASPEALREVKGIGEASAMLIKLIHASVGLYAASFVEPVRCYNTVGKIANFIWPRFLGLDHERLYLMVFDNKMAITDCIVLADGTVNAANVPLRKVVECALSKKAASVVLAHNHPHGLATPSESDYFLTQTLQQLLEMIDVPLLEHLLITEDRFLSIMRSRDWSSFATIDRERISKSKLDPEQFYDTDEEHYRFTPLLRKIAAKG